MCASLAPVVSTPSTATRSHSTTSQSQIVISQKRNLREAARRGARLLDNSVPGWFKKLKTPVNHDMLTTKLNLSYEKLAEQNPTAKRFPGDDDAINGGLYGFYAADAYTTNVGYDEAISILNAAWTREVTRRQQAN